MSFVTAVRDYVDVINANFDSFQQTFGGPITLAALTKGTFFYLLQSLKSAFLYIVTLQWLRDLVYLPVIIPKMSLAYFREMVFYPLRTVNEFVGEPNQLQNIFWVGFFNSFFASLPLTFGHLLSVRQFITNGWRAAAATNVGMIGGHLLFLAAVLFGWRPILIPWLQFEPWTYLIVIGITYYTVKSTFGRSAFYRFNTIPDFAKTAAIGFVLVLCDQGVIFKYLSTLTVSLEPTYLEPFTGTVLTQTQQHPWYLFGFFLGSVFFTALFFGVAFALHRGLTKVFGLATFTAFINDFSQIAFVSILFLSLSFYGMDFLCAKPLGYVPYDVALSPGNFAAYTVEDKLLSLRGIPAAPPPEDKMIAKATLTRAQKTRKKMASLKPPTFPLPLDLDLSSFDRGVHLRHVMASTHEMRTVESYRTPTSQFWSSRKFHRKAPRGVFARLLRLDFFKNQPKVSKKLQENLGFRMGRQPETGQTDRNLEMAARLRARRIAEMRRIWVRANVGSRQKFDQFTVFTNVTAPMDPYVPALTDTQIKILQDLDDLLNVPRADFAANLADIDKLIDEYETTLVDYREAPFASRFTTVEKLTKDVFEGRTTEQKKAKHRLTIWPLLFSFLHEQSPTKPMKQRILHDRLRENPYMSTLFRSDIDSFLGRQPTEQVLTAKEEAELFFKRRMLKSYVLSKQKITGYFRSFSYNWRRAYLKEAYLGGKSFKRQAYNHQFHGTYKVVRELMRMDLDPSSNPELARVMKYDMPLFTDGKDRMTSAHEELFPKLTKRRRNVRRPPYSIDSGRMRKTIINKKPVFLNRRPFYAGWDGDRRAFILTNRFVPTRVAYRSMRLNEKYPAFANLTASKAPSALQKATAPKATAPKGSTAARIKRIAFTTWPIPQRIAMDPILIRNYSSVFMADLPERHDVYMPPRSSKTPEDRRQRTKARDARALIKHFIPDFDFRPLQILFQEVHKPKTDLKQGGRAAQRQVGALSPSGQEKGFFTIDRWPAGFSIQRKTRNVWWLEEKPPVPFVDRGGYVWPGHEQLKININNYLPKWWTVSKSEVTNIVTKKPQAGFKPAPRS